DQAHVIAERVRSAIESGPVDIGEARLSVSVSVGVAVADLAVDDPDRLLRTADLAMYARKQQRAAERAAGIDSGSAPHAADPAHGASEAPSSTAASTIVAEPRRTDPFGVDLARALDADDLDLVHQ